MRKRDVEMVRGNQNLTAQDLNREVGRFRDLHPDLKRDAQFVAWFVFSYLDDNDERAVGSLVGISGDRGADAVYIDDKRKTVFIVQGKYRVGIAAKQEKTDDVWRFARLGKVLSGGSGEFKAFIDESKVDSRTEDRLLEARERITRRDYYLHLFYVTTGRFATDLSTRVRARVRRESHRTADIDLIGGTKVLYTLEDYMGGVAPLIPDLNLETEDATGIRVEGPFRRTDRREDVDSWVFSMNGGAVADIYAQVGERIFARNVRGYLGDAPVNKSIGVTLVDEPASFFYFNNGITIVCDEATREQSGASNILHVENPQIINGQQTTRQLYKHRSQSRKASVLVRVIRIPRSGEPQRRQSLIDDIVKATNWQNKISYPDLKANDPRQIQLERELRKFTKYYYSRKKMKKGEARKRAAPGSIVVTKEEFAYAVVACDEDPNTVVSQGKELIFQDKLYKRVFANPNPLYYLTRYWLMWTTRTLAKHFEQGKHARWVVLHFLWGFVSPLLRSEASKRAFVGLFEAKVPETADLRRATECVYREVLRFYRLKRGPLEAAAFFKRPKLDVEFDAYWRSSRNKSRQAFTKRMRKLGSALTT